MLRHKFRQPRCDTVAKLSRQTFTLEAQTFDVELRAAAEDRPNNSLFVGAYPAEVAGLVAKTRSAIADVVAANDGLVKGGCSASPVPSACAVPALQMSDAVDGLIRQLDAWSPYIH